jgi:hypothetical protein
VRGVSTDDLNFGVQNLVDLKGNYNCHLSAFFLLFVRNEILLN